MTFRRVSPPSSAALDRRVQRTLRQNRSRAGRGDATRTPSDAGRAESSRGFSADRAPPTAAAPRLRGYRVIHVICDNARLHDCQAVRDYLAEHGDRIVLHYLPKYAPETNPI